VGCEGKWRGGRRLRRWKGSRGADGRWVEERGPHRDGRDWSNAEAMDTRPKIPASPLAAETACRAGVDRAEWMDEAGEGEWDAIDTF
jgi:hypothetical protein